MVRIPKTIKSESTMNWPQKDAREEYEIDGFIRAYKYLPHGREFMIKSKGEKPDYILEDAKTHDLWGVELTSVYLNDRSVPDAHINGGDIKGIPYCENSIQEYKARIFQSITEKVEKAKAGYDLKWPLILSVYVNEYISIHMGEDAWNSFAKEHDDFWDLMSPFAEVVFWSLPNGGAFSIKSNDFCMLNSKKVT